MTLTQVALTTRRTVIISILLIVGLITFRVGSTFYYNYQLSKMPPIPPQAEQRFGKLPILKFPNSNVSSSNFSYSVDTTTGELPTFPSLIKVFFIPESQVSLLSPQKAREQATKFGFDIGPEIVGANIYQFKNALGETLSINITNGNFSYQINAPPSGTLPGKERLVTDFKDFLASKFQLPDDLLSGRGVVTNPESTSSATINLWPEPIEDIEIVTTNPDQALVRGVRVASDGSQSYSGIHYTFWEIDKTSSSTYFLKSPEEALQELKGNGGYIVKSPLSPKISITHVRVAYLETEDYSPFLQPIYIFEGPNFVAYVPGAK